MYQLSVSKSVCLAQFEAAQRQWGTTTIFIQPFLLLQFVAGTYLCFPPRHVF